MKKVLVSAIAVLMIAGAANATLIGLEWQNVAGPATAPTAVNTPVVAQFYMSNGPAGINPTLAGIGLVLNAWEDAAATIPANGVVFQTSSAPLIPGWATAAANNNSDLNGLQFAAANGPNFTPPDGKTVLMNISLQYTDATPLPQYYITIKRDITGGTSSAIFDNTGADYMTNNNIWDARAGYADSYGAEYWAFGNYGNPGWARFVKGAGEVGQTTANPLILVTPEPASLALLALGGFAALRRR
jgi:hypothetical protein